MPSVPSSLRWAGRFTSSAIVIAAVGACETAPTVRQGQEERVAQDLSEHAIVLSGRAGNRDGVGALLYDVFAVALDVGDTTENVTRSATRSESADVSPDGTRLALDRDCQIVTMGRDGRDRVFPAPTTSSGCNVYPRFSPDGRRIAFQSNRLRDRQVGFTSSLYDVFVVNADGSNLRHVSLPVRDSLGFNVVVLGWTPDGRVLFQTSGPFPDGDTTNPGTRTYSASADGTDVVRYLPTGDFGAVWAPNGSRMAFISARDGLQCVYVREAGSTTDLKLPQSCGTARSPSLLWWQNQVNPWSPDGTQLVFEVSGSVYAVNADGTDARRVPIDEPTRFGAWSRNGDSFAVIVGNDARVVRVNATTLEQVTISTGPRDVAVLYLP